MTASTPRAASGPSHDDDVTLRWNAMKLIADHGGPSIDARLQQLEGDPDLRARGMALYVVAKTRGEKALPTLRESLKSDSGLIRFDAVSALLMYGGTTGRDVVQEYALSGKEPSAPIRERIQGVLEGPRMENSMKDRRTSASSADRK
jgi:hypothetical protein